MENELTVQGKKTELRVEASPDGLTLRQWLVEREENALVIASDKHGADRDGWLEDAAYFRAAYCRLHDLERDLAALRAQSTAAGIEAGEVRGAALWALMHHQGGSSPVGQPLRRALRIAAHTDLTQQQYAEGKKAAGPWGPLVGEVRTT